MIAWQEIRCCACRRLLFKMTSGAFHGAVQIKCPRCSAFMNDVAGPHRHDQIFLAGLTESVIK